MNNIWKQSQRSNALTTAKIKLVSNYQFFGDEEIINRERRMTTARCTSLTATCFAVKREILLDLFPSSEAFRLFREAQVAKKAWKFERIGQIRAGKEQWEELAAQKRREEPQNLSMVIEVAAKHNISNMNELMHRFIPTKITPPELKSKIDAIKPVRRQRSDIVFKQPILLENNDETGILPFIKVSNPKPQLVESFRTQIERGNIAKYGTDTRLSPISKETTPQEDKDLNSKTKALGKLCKTLKLDTFFETRGQPLSGNIRRSMEPSPSGQVQARLSPSVYNLTPISNIEKRNSSYDERIQELRAILTEKKKTTVDPIKLQYLIQVKKKNKFRDSQENKMV
eukprot:TRINITY_DN4402_c0_g1_i3.p1 TRINITY_DN4402_c0_g1~~TRINITY_DN4402_c0_g1_i3.p1  ORF type:complete len:341 (-),score=60.03 TRINITY_DN4402_c0_g1_i3:126-1148(-)